MADIFAVGDIHGCFLTFQKLLGEMGVTDEDTLVSLGDLVDRGPRIREVLEYIANRDNTYVTIGNHDFYWFDHAENGRRASNEFMWNQGLSDTVHQLGGDSATLAAAIKPKIVPFIEAGNFVLCHSTYPWDKEKGDDKFTENHFWERWYNENLAYYAAYYKGPVIVHGHTPVQMGHSWEERAKDGRLLGINLDGGCCYRRPTSCLRGMRFSDGKVFEIANID